MVAGREEEQGEDKDRACVSMHLFTQAMMPFEKDAASCTW